MRRFWWNHAKDVAKPAENPLRIMDLSHHHHFTSSYCIRNFLCFRHPAIRASLIQNNVIPIYEATDKSFPSFKKIMALHSHWKKIQTYFTVYSNDTIFILGDGLTRLLLRWYLLLLRWEKSAPLLSCSWIFPGLNQGRGAGRDSNPGLPYSSPAH